MQRLGNDVRNRAVIDTPAGHTPRARPGSWVTRRVHGFGDYSHRSARRIALIVAAAFTLTGVAWVLVTDILLYSFIRDPVLVGRIETAKDWGFVGLAAVLLYVVTIRAAWRQGQALAVLSRVLDSMADGLLLLGRDRTIVHANPAALRMLRCQRLDELLGMGAVEFSRRFRVSYLDGSRVPPDRLISQRVFDEGGPLHYKALLHPTLDRELVISATAAAVRAEVDQPAEYVVSVLHDITDVEHLDQMRDELFNTTAHALKTPVAIIKANARDLWLNAPPKCQRPAAAVERQCARLERLIQNVLVATRGRTRTLRLYPHVVELGPLVERVARELRPPWSDRQVRTEIAGSVRVLADEERLAIALRNLADGAIRSSPSSSPLTLVLRQHDADAQLGVRHDGPSPEESPAPFAGGYDDLGLGRQVASMIARAHGGALREETIGSETSTWIDLPAIVGDER